MGWLGEPDQAGRQGLIEKSEPDLLELVKKRIKRPEPRDSESQPLDSLYAKYVRNPPLAFSFAHPGSPLPRSLTRSHPNGSRTGRSTATTLR